MNEPKQNGRVRHSVRAAACLALWVMVLAGRADVLIGTNGDRFTGTVVAETAESVVFDSELGGRLTVPRTRIRELQPAPTPITDHRLLITNAPAALSTPNPQTPTSFNWLPPAIGHDQEDWIQLKSGEWLRGRLYYVQQRKVKFDSDEMEDLSLDLKDVRKIYPANPLFAKFNGREQIYGQVVVTNEVVEVFGPEQVSLPREQLTGITPGGKREFDFWSGSLSIGMSLQSGNTRQTTLRRW